MTYHHRFRVRKPAVFQTEKNIKASPVDDQQEDVIGINSLQYPRVLLVNLQVVGSRSGLGDTLKSLFQDWPKESLAQISSVKQSVHDPFGIQTISIPSPPNLYSVLQRPHQYFHLFRSVAGNLLTDQLLGWITHFQPDLIYSILETPLETHLAVQLSRRLKIPLVPHIMDDWISLTPRILKDAILYHLRKQDSLWAIRNAPIRLVIGDDMANEYKERYGYSFFPIAHCVDPTNFHPDFTSNKSETRFICLVTGPGGRWESVVRFAKGLQQLIEEGLVIKLIVFTSKELIYPPAFGSWFEIRDFEPSEKELAKALTSADIAIIAEGSDEDSKTYFRFSFSAKLPLYMMAGCALLGIGPRKLASFQYILQNNIGWVLESENPKEMIHQMREILLDQDRMQQYRTNARNLALKEHDCRKVRCRFVQLLNQTVYYQHESSSENANPIVEL